MNGHSSKTTLNQGSGNLLGQAVTNPSAHCAHMQPVVVSGTAQPKGALRLRRQLRLKILMQTDALLHEYYEPLPKTDADDSLLGLALRKRVDVLG